MRGTWDSCGQIFGQRLSDFAASGKIIDMGHWFQCYAFDVIGEISYSQRFGFLDRGEDISGLLKALHEVLQYSTLVGIYAKWHPLVFQISSWLGLGGGEGRLALMEYVKKRIEQREEQKKHGVDVEETGNGTGDAPMDLLDKLMIANQHDPQKVTAYHIFMTMMSNIIAGSDTTAVSLSSILYYLLKYPDTMRKLRQEIHDCEEQGRCGNPSVSFKENSRDALSASGDEGGASYACCYRSAFMESGTGRRGRDLWSILPRRNDGWIEQLGGTLQRGCLRSRCQKVPTREMA